MPYNPHLNIQITPAQKAALENALEALKVALDDIGNVTLEAKKVKKLMLINNKRLPYLQRAVKEFSTAYPHLNSAAVLPDRANNLFDTLMVLRATETKVKEITDRYNDLNYNTQSILYKFMSDMYHIAKRYRSHLAGAEEVYSSLGELFQKPGLRNRKATEE